MAVCDIEVSVVCGRKDNFGFIATINSNAPNPPHIRITDLSENEVCRLIITERDTLMI